MSITTDAIFNTIENLSSPYRDLTREDLRNDALIERLSRDSATFRKAEEAIKILGDIINGSDDSIVKAAVVNGLNKQHRYLQEKLILALLGGLGDLGLIYSENPDRFSDARNVFAMNMLKALRERFSEELFWHDWKGIK